MSNYQYNNMNEVLLRIQRLEDVKRAERKREKMLKARGEVMGRMPQLGSGSGSDLKTLEKNLKCYLPNHMVPGNVGPINAVVWPFTYTVDFNFGVDPTISTNLRQTQSFQVSQEAGFMVMAITRDSREVNLAGSLGPWQVKMIDAQSSRQLQDKPMAFQSLGLKGNQTILPTPYFLFPNARFEVEMGGFNDPAASFVALGNAVHSISFFGYRVRVEDAQNVLSTIYGGK